MFGGTPTNFVYGFLKKIGGGVVMPKYFIDLKKCWGGGYAAVCQNILGIWKKCWWGGGVMPKYFTDLKNEIF